MTAPRPTGGRAVIGQVLLWSAVLMLLAAVLFWFRVVGLPDGMRPAVSIACLVVGVMDGVMALRFLGES
jgi:tellurite resistance protein TehA-like permease